VCTTCSVGTWSKQGDRKCTCCPAGTYAFNHLCCKDCLPGQYSKTSSEACTPCAAGQVSHAKSSTCKTCQAGTYANHIDNRCKKCTLDTYSLGAADSCKPCPSGTYSAMGSKECLRCGSGKYFDKARRVCVRCTSGSAGQPGCTSTAPPTAAPTEPPTLPPTNCPAGYYVTLPGFCLKCGKDQYSATPGSTSCLNCREGFVVNTAHTACWRCQAGYKVSEPPVLGNPLPDKICVACPVGSYSYPASIECLTICPNGGIPLRDRTGCTDGPARNIPSVPPTTAPTPTKSSCGAGQYADPTLNICINCSGGFYSSSDPRDPCQKCMPGMYTPPDIPNTECVRCGMGHVLNADNSQCTACPFGYYSTYADRYSYTDFRECKKCPEGYYARSGMGYQQQDGTIVNCDICKYGVNDAKTDCNGPYVKPYDWLPDPTPTSAPTPTYSKCSAGQYDDPILKQCVDCNPGYYSSKPSDPCQKCIPRTYASGNPASYCDRCHAGSIINDDSTDCVLCPAGYYSPYDLVDTDGNISPCKKCPPRTWSRAGYAFESYDLKSNVYDPNNCESCFYSDVNNDQTGCN
jgi:hypothetical protein